MASIFCPIFKSTRRGPGPCGRALVLGLVLWIGAVAPAAAQEGFPGAPDEGAVNLRVYPTDVWGPRVGVGVGLGLVGHGLARAADRWLLTAAPARREQVGTLSFASADPRRARRYVLVTTRALHTDRDWAGPWSVARSGIRGRVRYGHTFLDRRLLVQPHVSVLSTTIDDVRRRDGASAAAPPSPGQTGLRAGLDLRYRVGARRGGLGPSATLQGTWARYAAVDGSGLQFDRIDLEAYGTLSLTGRHRLRLRAHGTLTDNRSETPLPLYLQPVLGGTVAPGWARAQFVGPDRVLGSLLYRFPLFTLGRSTVVGGHLGTHVGAVYRDLGTQFAPRVRFDEAGPASTALRPSASAGLQFTVPFRPRAAVDLAVGVSPGGVTATRVTFTRRLQALRFPHHTADPPR